MANATSGSVIGNYGWANTQSAVPFWGHNASTGGTNWSTGVLGTSTGPNGRAIMGQATGAPTDGKLATGVYGEATSDQAANNTTGRSAGVTGTVSASTGSNYGVYGLIPSTGSSAAAGVRGENNNTSGGVGVSAYTAASSGRAILAYGSVMIENRSANGSATSGSDGLIVWSNSGASGFNASGALFTPSDRNVKNTFTAVDERDVLEKLAKLPVTKWHYRNDDKTWYMGPMAQDFMASFGLGDKDTVIHSVNADGVALAAIKGLNTKVEDRSKALEARLSQLEFRLTLLEQALAASQKIAVGNLGLGMAIIGLPVAAFGLRRRRQS
ncbi:MAG: tail fiber domain-containing protein [Planctomycetes bacterium]|nr:tail fiber domain-containing protein [Planctomycetota bacterium]